MVSHRPQSLNPAVLLSKRELGDGIPGPALGNVKERTAVENELHRWRERDFLEASSAEYALFQPAPRSTIALCYNCDGTLLASTHGDHTVKLMHYATKSVYRTLTGHRRTPWVVRFHPQNPFLLASGSLDHEVRLWDATSGRCIAKHLFGKPIASLAFHGSRPIIAIACGHKLYVWDYTVPGATPTIVLRTRRSMRAVHFHPQGLPLLLTGEVQDPSPTFQLPEALHEEIATVGYTPGSSSELPKSMVPIAWEVPFPALANLESPMLPPAAVTLAALASASSAETRNWDPQGLLAQVATAYSASMWNIVGEDQPPRVRLRLWNFDASKPTADLESCNAQKLEINDAVLCSEMGVHFSPCGRFLAATVACRAPFPNFHHPNPPALQTELGGGEENDMDWSPTMRNASGVRTQQGRHGEDAQNEDFSTGFLLRSGGMRTPTQRLVFEVRILALDGALFGKIMNARRVKAAHCLTSVQFSPAGDHLLLAYGKKHSNLLRSLVPENGSLVPLHTIMEVVSLGDMSLLRVLPSTEDEINAACFHPSPGGGIAYGTKEGRLRLLGASREEEEGGGSADRSGVEWSEEGSGSSAGAGARLAGSEYDEAARTAMLYNSAIERFQRLLGGVPQEMLVAAADHSEFDGPGEDGG
jgi:activator-of-BECN1-regulated-autophagy protein 1